MHFDLQDFFKLKSRSDILHVGLGLLVLSSCFSCSVSTGRSPAHVVLQRGAEGHRLRAQAPLFRDLQSGSVDRNLQQPAQVSLGHSVVP